MSVSLTEEQRAAIGARGQAIVSASAGSGKTFVMIERLVALVLGGTDVRNVLAVTFTNKAAAQMRERLRAALLKAIRTADAPTRRRLKAQLEALPMAEISTIHAFCGRLVRAYFYKTEEGGEGFGPNFRIISADDAEGEELSARAMDEVFEAAYADGEGVLYPLLSVYFRRKRDTSLRKLLRELYASAREEGGYREKLASMGREGAFSAVCRELVAGYRARAQAVADDLARREEGYIALGERAAALARAVSSSALALCACGDLFAMCAAAVLPDAFARTPSRPKASPGEKEALAALAAAKKRLKDLKEELAGFGSAEEEAARFADACARSAALGDLLLAYDDAYARAKREAGVLDYNDLEHFALRLLHDEEVLREVRQKYRVVFVDEYQDVNPIQEQLLAQLAGDELFLVGDAKQAIYGFRGSRSRYFTQKTQTLPVSLVLSSNFRSAPAVLEAVNRVFAALFEGYVPMRGGERYGVRRGETLLHRVEKPLREKTPPTGVYSVLQSAARKEEDPLAACVASLIAREVKDGVWYDADDADADGPRKKRVTYGDIAVLTRRRGGEAARIVRVLSERGIPVSTAAEVNVCDYFEARLVLDILSYLDNPEQDIPFVSSLLSALGGMTEEELARIRLAMGERDASGADYPDFRAVCAAYRGRFEDGIAQKLRAFSDMAERLRAHACVRTAAETINELLALGLETQLAAKPEGASRLARVRRLAAEGEDVDVHTFLARLKSAGYRVGFSEGGGENAVQVITMHASKGLEFPVVILAGLNVPFHGGAEREEVLWSEEYGAAPKSYDTQGRLVYTTVLRRLLAAREADETRREEANLLYVGMTRARYRLHLLQESREKAAPFAPESARCMADLIDPAALTACAAEAVPPAETAPQGTAVQCEGGMAEDSLADAYRRPYPFAESTRLPVKSSATALMRAMADMPSLSRPVFSDADDKFVAAGQTDEGGVSQGPFAGLADEGDMPAGESSIARGIAYHVFLQHVRFGADLAGEWERVRREGLLGEEQLALLDRAQLAAILAVPCLASLDAARLRREQTFLVRLPANELLPTSADDEIVFQGAIDLLSEDESGYTIVDYKYSALDDDALRKKYALQILLYKKAAARILGVDERTLRAFIVNIARCREIKM